jgi:hypothetical protein
LLEEREVQEFRGRQDLQGPTGLFHRSVTPSLNQSIFKRRCVTARCLPLWTFSARALALLLTQLQTKAEQFKRNDSLSCIPSNPDEQQLEPDLQSMHPLTDERGVHFICNECKIAQCQHSTHIKTTDLCRILAQNYHVPDRNHAFISCTRSYQSRK